MFFYLYLSFPPTLRATLALALSRSPPRGELNFIENLLSITHVITYKIMQLTKYLRPTAPSQTLLLNEQSRQLEDAGRKVYKFGFGQSPFLPPEHVMEALKKYSARKEYTPVQGLPELRQKAAAFHSEIDGINADESRVMVAPGSKALLYTVMMAFAEAEVLIPAPAWVSYASPQAQLCGHNITMIKTDYESRWRVTPESLEESLRARKDKNIPCLLVLNYPGNPEGLTYTKEELAELTQIFRREEIWVLSDEIYGLLHHEGRHVSLQSIYPERTIVTTGLSKWAGAGGWRLGIALLPEDIQKDFMQTLLGIASETYSCAPAPVQAAACEAYMLDERIKNYLGNQRSILKVIGNKFHSQLSSSGVLVHAPEGGFYLLVCFEALRESLIAKNISEDVSLCAAILKDTGVALLPGSAFGLPAELLTARLAYVDFDGNAAMQEMLQSPDQPKVSEIVSSHCSHSIEGLKSLSSWCVAQ